jgi:hypothetical protein
MRGGHFMVVCCRDVSRPGCATAPVHICGDVAPDRSARTRFDHHHTSRYFPAINIPVVNVISKTISWGRFRDVLPLGRCAFFGIAYSEFSDADREAIVAAYPRTEHFKENIIQTFYEGIKHKPETTFGNVKADVLADKDPKFQRMNFCNIIRGSQWKG